MTRDEVVRIAKKAGMQGLFIVSKLNDLERFAALVEAAKREEFAKLCDRFAERNMHPAECAAAIRARGESK